VDCGWETRVRFPSFRFDGQETDGMSVGGGVGKEKAFVNNILSH
jgi:hypothetical protein